MVELKKNAICPGTSPRGVKMGDDYSVSAHRKRDSASSSSPKALSLKDRQNDFSVVEAESLLPARESGDPGEVMHKIIDNKRVKDLSEVRN